MITVSFIVRNPWHNETKNPWRDIYQQAWPLFKHKTLEVGIFKYAYNLFELSVGLNFRGSDHAGPSLNISLFGWEIYVGLPDSRHWDYKNNCWEAYENSNE